MTNREEANKLASKIKGETVNADTTKKALEAIGGKSAGSMAEALENIVQGDIPSGGGATAYCWHRGDGGEEERGVMYFNFDKAPADLTELNQKKLLVININDIDSPYLIEAYSILISAMSVKSYTRTDDNTMEFSGITFTRQSTKDFTLW